MQHQDGHRRSPVSSVRLHNRSLDPRRQHSRSISLLGVKQTRQGSTHSAHDVSRTVHDRGRAEGIRASRGRRLDRHDEKKSQGASCARVNHAHVQFTWCAVLELVNEVQNHQLLMQSLTMLTQQAKTQSAAAVSKQNSLTEGLSADTAAKDGNIASTRAGNVEPNAEVEGLNTDTCVIQYVNTHAAQHGRRTVASQVESKESTMRIRTK